MVRKRNVSTARFVPTIHFNGKILVIYDNV